MDLQKVFIEGETLHYILQEDSDETYMEASKVWYGTLDNKETLNQRIDAIIDYWMKRGLEKPALRAMIKELKRQYEEQNQQTLLKETEMNSMCSGDNNLSCVSSKREGSALNKEITSDVEELKTQQAQQNLQVALKGTSLSSLWSNGSNLSNVCSSRDVLAPTKETNPDIDEIQNKLNTKLHKNDTQDLTDEESTVHSGSVVNKLPIDLNLPFMTGCGKQNISSVFLANRELSTMPFENIQLSTFDSPELKVLRGLLNFLANGLMNSTILQEVQTWLKPVLQNCNDEKTKALIYLLLKQIGIGFRREPRQLSLLKDKKSTMVKLSEQGEYLETSGTKEYELKKKRSIAFNENSCKDCSVKSGVSKCVNAMDFHSAQYLLNKKLNDTSEIPFRDALQSDTEHKSNKLAKQKKYANKEVQTISTGEILYFKIVPDM